MCTITFKIITKNYYKTYYCTIIHYKSQKLIFIIKLPQRKKLNRTLSDQWFFSIEKINAPNVYWSIHITRTIWISLSSLISYACRETLKREAIAWTGRDGPYLFKTAAICVNSKRFLLLSGRRTEKGPDRLNNSKDKYQREMLMGRGMNSGRKALTSRRWCKGTANVAGNAGRKTSTDSSTMVLLTLSQRGDSCI